MRFGLMWGFDELVLMRISTAHARAAKNLLKDPSAFKVSSESWKRRI